MSIVFWLFNPNWIKTKRYQLVRENNCRKVNNVMVEDVVINWKCYGYGDVLKFKRTTEKKNKK